MSTSLIRVPDERAAQLRMIADHKSVTVADLIGDLANAEMDRLGLSTAVGASMALQALKLEDDTIVFKGRDVGHLEWTQKVALAVADTLEALATPTREKVRSVLDLDANIKLTRVGTSVKFENNETGDTRTFAPSIARDIASMIRRSVADKI